MTTPPDVQVGVSFNKPDTLAIDILSKVTLSDFMDLTEDLEKRILKIIVEDDIRGLGIARMVKDITDQIDSVDSDQAEILSRTAVGQAYNRAAWERIVKYAPFKLWIDTGDDRERPGHLKMHHVIIPAEEPFDVPAFTLGDRVIPACRMQYPGDMTYKPDMGQIICCRCTLGPKFTRSGVVRG